MGTVPMTLWATWLRRHLVSLEPCGNRNVNFAGF